MKYLLRSIACFTIHLLEKVIVRLIESFVETMWSLNLQTSVFNQCIETDAFPFEWEKGSIVSIHKKGDKQILKNYRPVAEYLNVPCLVIYCFLFTLMI